MHSKRTDTRKAYNKKIYILNFVALSPTIDIDDILKKMQHTAIKLKIKACLNNNANIVSIPS